jgi:hypothetical protein
MTRNYMVKEGRMPFRYNPEETYTREQIANFRETWFYLNVSTEKSLIGRTTKEYNIAMHVLFRFLRFLYHREKELVLSLNEQQIYRLASNLVELVAEDDETYAYKFILKYDLKQVIETKIEDMKAQLEDDPQYTAFVEHG